MEKFGINTAKSYLGRNVNLHLKDGSVIVNVLLTEIQKGEFRTNAFVECIAFRSKNTFKIPLKKVAWADLLNLNLILLANKASDNHSSPN
jgi:hypothetical protein